MAKWVCPVCGYVYEGDAAPEKCPQCGVPGSKFKKEEPGKAGYACEHVIAKRAKELGYDAIHDTVHEMAKDEARHGAGFTGLYNRYFK